MKELTYPTPAEYNDEEAEQVMLKNAAIMKLLPEGSKPEELTDEIEQKIFAELNRGINDMVFW